MTVAPEELRTALRQWASGVTIVTAGSGGVLHGMTVSSFASVSLDPPLISVNIEQRTRTHKLMTEAGSFAVSILAEDQQELANRFGGGVPDRGERMAGVPYRLGEFGNPIIRHCLGNLECSTYATVPAGTHTVFVGEVVGWSINKGKRPLVYWMRRYRSLSDDR